MSLVKVRKEYIELCRRREFEGGVIGVVGI